MCQEALPTAILARLTQLGADLLAWAQQHADAPLAQQEQAVLGLLRAAAPDLLSGMLVHCTRALSVPVAGLRHPCPQCGKQQGSHDWRERQVETVCGTVRYERPYYYCRSCQGGWCPADQSLGVADNQRLSAGLEDWLVRVGAQDAFRGGRDLLRDLTGVAVAAETIRQHAEAVGARLEAAQQQAATTVHQTLEAAEPVDAAPGLLVVEADGVMVPYRDGWHEMKVGAVGGHQGKHTGHLSYVAAREPADAFGRRLVAEAARRGALEVVGWRGPLGGACLAELREVVVLGDGAHWIWELAAQHFGTGTEIVDFYHASEHLWEVAHALYGQGSAAAKDWAETQVGVLLEHGVVPVLRAFFAARPSSQAAAEVLRRERGYFVSNRQRMAYPDFRARGLPIGSGAVESAARHVIQQRLKRPGARWKQPGAQAIATVCAHLRSGRPLRAASPAPEGPARSTTPPPYARAAHPSLGGQKIA
jgi:hypothetical protein